MGHEQEHEAPTLHEALSLFAQDRDQGAHACPTLTEEEVLRIPMMVILPQGQRHFVKALVDTGAEFNLCNQRLLPSVVWQKAPTPVRLMAANGSVVPGGDVTLDVRLVMNGKPQSFSAPTRGYNVPATIYGADITEDSIISYSWMVEQNGRVHPRVQSTILGSMHPLVWISANDCNHSHHSQSSTSTLALMQAKAHKKRIRFHIPPEIREIPSWKDEPDDSYESEQLKPHHKRNPPTGKFSISFHRNECGEDATSSQLKG